MNVNETVEFLVGEEVLRRRRKARQGAFPPHKAAPVGHLFSQFHTRERTMLFAENQGAGDDVVGGLLNEGAGGSEDAGELGSSELLSELELSGVLLELPLLSEALPEEWEGWYGG